MIFSLYCSLKKKFLPTPSSQKFMLKSSFHYCVCLDLCQKSLGEFLNIILQHIPHFLTNKTILLGLHSHFSLG